MIHLVAILAKGLASLKTLLYAVARLSLKILLNYAHPLVKHFRWILITYLFSKYLLRFCDVPTLLFLWCLINEFIDKALKDSRNPLDTRVLLRGDMILRSGDGAPYAHNTRGEWATITYEGWREVRTSRLEPVGHNGRVRTPRAELIAWLDNN